MPSQLPKYSLRIPEKYLRKMKYIAEENARSVNREIEILVKKRIQEYEKLHGEIDNVAIEQFYSDYQTKA